MALIETIPDDEASGPVPEMYEADRGVPGYAPNSTRAFSQRRVCEAWRQLSAAIKKTMDPRRYELVTVAAARRLHSSWRTLAHPKALARAKDKDALQRLGGRNSVLDSKSAFVERAGPDD